MRYALARFKKEQRDDAYRIYITDSLYYLRREESLTYRYFDWINKDTNIDYRTADEIAVDIIKRANLNVEGSETDGFI